ncbi:MAG: hypothetical protein LBL34_04215 [Clostridiales bacterium]|nr:hypothetical protein [Clostridiales bacterium]
MIKFMGVVGVIALVFAIVLTFLRVLADARITFKRTSLVRNAVATLCAGLTFWFVTFWAHCAIVSVVNVLDFPGIFHISNSTIFNQGSFLLNSVTRILGQVIFEKYLGVGLFLTAFSVFGILCVRGEKSNIWLWLPTAPIMFLPNGIAPFTLFVLSAYELRGNKTYAIIMGLLAALSIPYGTSYLILAVACCLIIYASDLFLPFPPEPKKEHRISLNWITAAISGVIIGIIITMQMRFFV